MERRQLLSWPFPLLIVVSAALSILLVSAGSTRAQTVFMDDFGDGFDYTFRYHRSSTSDDTAVSSFDYGTVGIPPAPNTTDGTTFGVKFGVCSIMAGDLGGLSLAGGV
jgi:hypothetical protein